MVLLPAEPMPFVKRENAKVSADEGGYETWAEGDTARTLNSMGQAGTNGAVVVTPFHTEFSNQEAPQPGGPSAPLTTHATAAVHIPEEDPVEPTSAGVRRLTPTECERLQAFPDGWTIP